MLMLDVRSESVILISDATFPVFQETDNPRVITIEFGELPEDISRRKSHLSDNGIRVGVAANCRCISPLNHELNPQLAKLYISIHIQSFLACQVVP
jgi:hypothetical protein